jgi:hypothetical protein
VSEEKFSEGDSKMRSTRVVPSLFFTPVLFALMLTMPALSFAQFVVLITIPPPDLPVYEQPFIPGPGYIWTPGYWAWSPEEGGYFWVPGTWVLAPQVGMLWTPGYWSWAGNAFIWNPGYWSPHIGFYGGVNYGFGYTGSGYEGGYWNNGAFFYNRAVNNITNVTNITNVYNKTVVNEVTVTRVSYNGGRGGITAQPTTAQRAAASERHIPPTLEQTQHQRAASTNRALLASVNHGKPPIAGTSKPGAFSGHGVVAAKAAAPYHPAVPAVANRTAPRSPNPAGGGTRSVVTPHRAPLGNAEQPAGSTRRISPSEGRQQPARPMSEGARPNASAQERAAASAEHRSAPSTKSAVPQSAPPPPAVQYKNAPPASSAPRPGEKPREE